VKKSGVSGNGERKKLNLKENTARNAIILCDVVRRTDH